MYSQCVSRAPLICRLLSVRYLGLLLVPFHALGMCVIIYVLIYRIIKGLRENVKGLMEGYYCPQKYIFCHMSAYKKHLYFYCILCIIAFGLSSRIHLRRKEERL